MQTAQGFNQPVMPKQRNQVPTWLGFLIIIIVAVLVSGSVCAYQYFYIQSQEAKLAVVETPKSETAGWKTYKNDEYGFEIRYPVDYILSEKSEKQYIYDFQISKVVSLSADEQYIDESSFSVFVDNASSNFKNCLKADYGIVVTPRNLDKTKEINGNKFYVYWDKQGDAAMGGERSQMSQYHIIHDNYCYIVDFNVRWHIVGYAGIINNGKSDATPEQTQAQQITIEKHEKILEQIFSTFKFTK